MASQELDIRRYLRLAHKRRYVLVAVSAVVIGAAVIAAYTLPPLYRAQSTVFIERNVIENLVKDIAITPSMEDRLSVLSYAIKSRNLLMKVLEDLELDATGAAREQLIEELQAKTEVTTDTRRQEMNLFKLAYTDRDPVFARDYVNALARRYIEENVSEKRQEAYGANRFLNEQIDHFKQRLDAAEDEIVQFRKERGIFIATNESHVVEEIKRLEEQVEELKIQKMELNARRSTLSKQLKEENPYMVSILGRRNADPAARLRELEVRLSELLMNYTENYPDVILVQAEIEALKEQVKGAKGKKASRKAEDADTELSTLNPLFQQLKEDLSDTNLQLAALEARQENVRRLITQKESYLRDIPEEKKKLLDMERERNTYQNIYEKLIERLGQSEVSKQMEIQDKAATFRVVDPAVLPIKPVSPNRVRIILMGLFLGLAAGMGSVLALEHLDKTVRSVEQLKTLGYPVLAMIPRIRNEQETNRIRRRDAWVYGLSGAYLALVLAIMAKEQFALTLPGIVESVMNMLGGR